MTAPDTAIIILLQPRKDAEALRNALSGQLWEAAKARVVLCIPPIRGLDFFDADGADSLVADEWWQANVPGDVKMVYVLDHEDGLAQWLDGLDGTVFVGWQRAAEKAAYASLGNTVQVCVDEKRENRIHDFAAAVAFGNTDLFDTVGLDRAGAEPADADAPEAGKDVLLDERSTTEMLRSMGIIKSIERDPKAVRPAATPAPAAPAAKPTPAPARNAFTPPPAYKPVPASQPARRAASAPQAAAAPKPPVTFQPVPAPIPVPPAAPVDDPVDLLIQSHPIVKETEEAEPFVPVTGAAAKPTATATEPTPTTATATAVRPASTRARRSGLPEFMSGRMSSITDLFDSFRKGAPEVSDEQLSNVVMQHRPLLIAVGSRAGGVGKTTSAVALALQLGALTAARGAKTALVDGNVVNPDAWGDLNLEENAATVSDIITSLATNPDRNPPQPVVRAKWPGLSVYPENREPGTYSKTDIDRFASYLKQRYAAIVVDLPNRMPGLTDSGGAVIQYWLEHADVLVLPTDSGKSRFQGVLEYLELDVQSALALPPVIVAYLAARSKVVKNDPHVRGYLNAIAGREKVHSIVDIPDDDRVNLAFYGKGQLLDISPDLRKAYRRLVEAVLAAKEER